MSNEQLSQRIMTSGQFLVTGSITHQIDDYAKNYLKEKQGQPQDMTIGILWAGANDYISKEAFSNSISALLSKPTSEEGYNIVIDRVIDALKEQGREDILVVIGGVIPPQDFDELRGAGVAAIFPPGTVIAEAAMGLLDKLNQDLGYV